MNAVEPAEQMLSLADVSAAPRAPAVLGIDASLGLFWLAALLAGGVVHATDANLHLQHPVALLPACLWLLWPARNVTVKTIQVVVFLYLAWILFAGPFDVFWTFPWLGDTHLRVSSTVPMTGLIGAGWLLRRRRGPGPYESSGFPAGALVWVVLLLAAHSGLLVGGLSRVYGFGWEQDQAVFGRIALGVIVLMGLSPVAAIVPARASLSVLFAIVFLARCVS
jgi:hypothetical protein